MYPRAAAVASRVATPSLRTGPPPLDPLAPCGPPPWLDPPQALACGPPEIVVLSSAIWGYLSICYNPLQYVPILQTYPSRLGLCHFTSHVACSGNAFAVSWRPIVGAASALRCSPTKGG